MEFLPKIAIFYACLWIALLLLKRSPHSWPSKLAFSWLGPVPEVGERRSRFLTRQALFSASWLIQIAFVAAVVIILVKLVPSLRSSQAFQIVTAFALSIGAAMALVSTLYFMLASLKASLVGPNPLFELVTIEEPESEPNTEA